MKILRKLCGWGLIWFFFILTRTILLIDTLKYRVTISMEAGRYCAAVEDGPEEF